MNDVDWDAGDGMLWPHLYVISEVIKQTSKCYIFSYDRPLITVQFGNQGWTKKDAICTYYRGILLYEKMINKCDGHGKDDIRCILSSVVSPTTQKSDDLSINLIMAKEFYRLYKEYYGKGWFIKWVKFAIRLLFTRRKDFFYGKKG